ncbi:MAG: IS110 family transposase [Bacteroidales bacterium]|jgi:transposase|nr:IS110 family transposase [Bacteroidales bacterium]
MEKVTKKEVLAGIPVLNFHAAGIDVGSMLMAVSYTDSSGNRCLFDTGGFTKDLNELVSVLKEEGITDVAMEATGVYWMSLHELLEDAGINITLINPGHYKNSSHQKTDIQDCQWIHQYHSCGILRNSHIAKEGFRELRNYIHERNVVQTQKAETLTRMQRLLTKMNIKIQHVVSDIEGVGCMKILRAIASGVTDPQALLALIDTTKFKASKETLFASLTGIYKKQFVELLRMKLVEYDFFVRQMHDYDKLIEGVLISIEEISSKKVSVPEEETKKEETKKDEKKKVKKTKIPVRKNQYTFESKGYLHRILGVDLTKIDGFEEKGLLAIMSVTGTDMSKWVTVEHFVSWLGLNPRRCVSGGRLLGHEKKKVSNPATQAFRLSAQSLAQSKSPLGQLYRRLAVNHGSKTANKAVARKLAVLFYTLVKNQTEYDTTRIDQQTQKQEERKLEKLKKMAEKMGYSICKTA